MQTCTFLPIWPLWCSYKKIARISNNIFSLTVNASFPTKIFHVFMKQNKQYAKVFSRRNSQKTLNPNQLTFLDEVSYLDLLLVFTWSWGCVQLLNFSRKFEMVLVPKKIFELLREETKWEFCASFSELSIFKQFCSC